MTKFPTAVALMLLLVCPSVGLAATQDAPIAEERPLATAPQPEPFTRAPLGVRLLSEAAFGTLGALGGFFGGGLVGSTLCPAGLNEGAGSCFTESFYGAMAGSLLAFPLGVWLGGTIAQGTGNLGFTYLGALAGTAANGLLYVLSGQYPYVALLGLVLPVIGTILGYEFSMRPEPPRVALGGTRIQPLLSVSSKGGFLGLGGTF